MTNVLLIGNGGREHALAESLKDSKRLKKLYVAMGNPGIAKIAECISLDINVHQDVVKFAKDKKIDLVVIGPEAPLVDGLGDELSQAGIACFGPSKQAARLEGSKEFARSFCNRHGILQPNYEAFNNGNEAKAYIKKTYPDGVCVIKADGLAGGKGVVVADNQPQALAAIDSILGDSNSGPNSGQSQVVIEERIYGTEASLFAMVDGRDAILMGSAQDYKRALDGDKGPNTGGMGAISPAPALSDELLIEAWQNVILKTINGMAEDGSPYRGFLYAGLMLTNRGVQVIEFNCRFGDPEAEAILPRLDSDLLEAMLSATTGKLGDTHLSFTSKTSVSVVMVNEGYPSSYETGGIISGLDDHHPDTKVFHSGTSLNDKGQTTATGGRVLVITALGDDAQDARSKAYARVKTITWPQKIFRKDIGAVKPS